MEQSPMSSAASEIPLTANTDLPALWANLLGSGFSNPQLSCYVEQTFSPFCVQIADLCAKYLTDVFCLLFIVFFLRFFYMWTRFKFLLNLLQYCFCLMLWFCILFCFVLLQQGMWDLRSMTRGQTCTPCTGRWSQNHRTVREVPLLLF